MTIFFGQLNKVVGLGFKKHFQKKWLQGDLKLHSQFYSSINQYQNSQRSHVILHFYIYEKLTFYYKIDNLGFVSQTIFSNQVWGLHVSETYISCDNLEFNGHNKVQQLSYKFLSYAIIYIFLKSLQENMLSFLFFLFYIIIVKPN